MLLLSCTDLSDLSDSIANSMLDVQRNNSTLALLHIDISSVSPIVDFDGWEDIMSSYQSALVVLLDPSSSTFRTSVSEFIIVLRDSVSCSPSRLCSELIIKLSPPLPRKTRFDTYVNIGHASFPENGDTVHSLLRSADAALHRSKMFSRGGFALCSSEIELVTAKDLEHDIHRALELKQFVLSFQPIVDSFGALQAFEVLVRWHHPDAGIIGPDVFIPLCEKNGLIIPLGEWVMDTALRQYRDWQKAGFLSCRLCVNVSPVQLLSSSFIHYVFERMCHLGLNAGCLEIELTESAYVSDPKLASKRISELRMCGVRIALDDFGTGMSTLSHLKLFHADALKIDRSFICDLPSDRRSQVIVQGLIDMAHSMGMTVVAEGIENALQLEFLRSLGCDEFQGYYFGRPTDVSNATQMLYIAKASEVCVTL